MTWTGSGPELDNLNILAAVAKWQKCRRVGRCSRLEFYYDSEFLKEEFIDCGQASVIRLEAVIHS